MVVSLCLSRHVVFVAAPRVVFPRAFVITFVICAFSIRDAPDVIAYVLQDLVYALVARHQFYQAPDVVVAPPEPAS